MNKLIAFFEIPAVDFNRATKFYETILGVKMTRFDYEHEKMAFFPQKEGLYPGAISWTSQMDFTPAQNGVLVSLSCNNMEQTIDLIKINGGKIVTQKTKIEAEGRGYFAVLIDSEGNRLGLYSDK